jgi:hypothetical protein
MSELSTHDDEPENPGAHPAAPRWVVQYAVGAVMLAGFSVVFLLAAPTLFGPERTTAERVTAVGGVLLGFAASIGLARVAGESSRAAVMYLKRAEETRGRIEALLTSIANHQATFAAANRSAQRDAIAEIRMAIERGEWEVADRRLADLAREFPESREAVELENEIAAGRQVTADGLRARLDASRAVNDPDGVLSAREELGRVLPPDNLGTLDRDLARWLMGIIQKRMRTGTVRPDVAILAERASSVFGTTIEGASLRASLPILRRSAGLCPRCGKPYTGVDDACPECLGPGATPEEAVPSLDELVSRPPDLGAYADGLSSDDTNLNPGPDLGYPRNGHDS